MIRLWAARAFAITLAAVIVAVVAAIVVPGAEVVAGSLVLLAALLGLVIASRSQRVIAGILIAVGAGCFIVALALGAEPSIDRVLALNQDLTGMLAAASFLGAVARVAEPAVPRLQGAAAVWRTAGVIHFLGAVINMSAITVVGDHLRGQGREGRLRGADALLLTRGYTSGAFWSPFWAAAAAALLVAPEADFPTLVALGLPLALLSLALSMPWVFRALGDELPTYRGYALSWGLLRIPLTLVAAVIVVHLIAPETPVPRVVALSAIVVTAIVLVARERRDALRALGRQALVGLPALRGEVTLFTSAGVLSVGVGALLSRVPVSLPLAEFTVPVAWCCIVAMILLSVVGVHALISIGVLAAVVAPLDPNPTLFAMTAMIAWGACASVGPLSGIQMYMHGRFGVDGMQTTRRNLPFVGAVLLLAWPVLLVAAA